MSVRSCRFSALNPTAVSHLIWCKSQRLYNGLKDLTVRTSPPTLHPLSNPAPVTPASLRLHRPVRLLSYAFWIVIPVSVILCLSHNCILGAVNLFLEFHRFDVRKNYVSGWIILRASPIPDLDNLDEEKWDFWGDDVRQLGSHKWRDRKPGSVTIGTTTLTAQPKGCL